jgi:uncharacterized protein
MASIFDLLLPKEKKFFTYMDQQADIFLESAKVFKALITQLPDLSEDAIHTRVNAIKDFEGKGDAVERFVIDELEKTFITPLDREDIHSIVTNIDHSLDILHSIAQKVEIYKMRRMPPNAAQFAVIIVDCAAELKRLINSLKDKKETDLLIKKIHILENEADNLIHLSIAGLFSTDHTATDLVRYKDIYEQLESLVNSIDHVAKIIRGVVVKGG